MINEKFKYFIPPIVWRAGKKNLALLRFRWQRFRCKRAFNLFADRYPQKVYFIVGLPKSGTTWLEKMICSYPGIKNILIPEATHHELKNMGGHNYQLPYNFLDRFKNMIVLSKMHIPGSKHNAMILRQFGDIRYVVVYRDLRDVAVSHYFYVKRTPWHPEFPKYRKLNIDEGLKYFAENTLDVFEQWIRSWHRNRDEQNSIIVTYEQLLADTFTHFTRIAQHFQLDSRPETISKIVKTNKFKNLSGGRKRGHESRNSFFRSGTSGNWKNYFTPEIKGIYKNKIGDFLIELGYEQEKTW